MRPALVMLLLLAGCGSDGMPRDSGGTDLAVDQAVDPMIDLAAAGDLTAAPDLRNPIGQPCGDAGMCSIGVCLDKYPEGYCTVRNCDGPDAGCPAGSQCSGGGAIGSTGCFVTCVDHGDCRTGYRCCANGRAMKLCVPPGTAFSC
jgi:hypothetical protein